MLKWEIITLNNHECVVFKEAKYIVAMTTVKPKLFSVLWPNVERKRMHYTLTGIYRTEPITLNFLLGTKGVNVFLSFPPQTLLHLFTLAVSIQKYCQH